MTKNKTSVESIAEASRSRAKFSGHGRALGAAGHKEACYDPENSAFLREPGQCLSISPGEKGFQSIMIGAAWDCMQVPETGMMKIFRKTRRQEVDIDIGCLYELQDGTRGAIQAFGDKFGSFDSPPYIALSGDERTGDARGFDEYLLVNGGQWDKIKRVLVYIYIYEGTPNWAMLNPKVVIDVPGDDDLVLTLGVHNDALCLCAVGMLENVRGGIKLTNQTEYFPGHQEMDRAFGFGLPWDDGKK